MTLTEKKVFVMDMNAVMAGTCEFTKLRFKPWFFLVSGPGNSVV